jgi:hypothetical protein
LFIYRGGKENQYEKNMEAKFRKQKDVSEILIRILEKANEIPVNL